MGCNGIGKSTLLNQMNNALEERKNTLCMERIEYTEKEELDKIKTIYLYCSSNQLHNPNRARGDVFVSNLQRATSSSGEYVFMALNNYLELINDCLEVLEKYKIDPHKFSFVIILDGADESLNIPAIRIMRAILTEFIKKLGTDNTYIVLSASTYELARMGKCHSALTNKKVDISKYDTYSDYIFETYEYYCKRMSSK